MYQLTVVCSAREARYDWAGSVQGAGERVYSRFGRGTYLCKLQSRYRSYKSSSRTQRSTRPLKWCLWTLSAPPFILAAPGLRIEYL
jgi:hypothetical protein